MDSSTGNEIFGTTAPGFVVNYSYPAFVYKCGTSTNNVYHMGLQVRLDDDSYKYRTW